MKMMLEGIRVADLTHVWFGPFCTMQLASLGAEVIKVEPPWGDMTRIGRPDMMLKGRNPTFEYLNRNKKGIILNLKSERGRKVFLDLVKVSDVVVENFMPGTMKKLGLDYEVLKATNPRIIYAALSGYGQYGPYTYRPSFDIVGQAISGIMWSTGLRIDPEGPPIHSAEAIGDLVPGSWAVLGILAALYYRQVTGEGQMVDVSQVDVMTALVPSVAQCAALGLPMKEIVKRERSIFWGYYGVLKVKDGYIVVGAPVVQGIFDRMQKVMGMENVNTREQVQEWARNFTMEEVLKKLTEGDVPCAPILSADQVPYDPHIQAREGVVDVEVQQIGKVKQPNFPLKFSKTPASVYRPAPLIGQHAEEVLTNILGYSKEDVENLRKEKVI